MSNYLWVKTDRRKELIEEAVKIPEFSRKALSEILELALEEFVKRHGKSNNPQSQLSQFNKEGILQVPHIYAALDNPKQWQKFFGMIKTKKELKNVSLSIYQINKFLKLKEDEESINE